MCWWTVEHEYIVDTHAPPATINVWPIKQACTSQPKRPATPQATVKCVDGPQNTIFLTRMRLRPKARAQHCIEGKHVLQASQRNIKRPATSQLHAGRSETCWWTAEHEYIVDTHAPRATINVGLYKKHRIESAEKARNASGHSEMCMLMDR